MDRFKKSSNGLQRPSCLELEIMLIIWEHGRTTARDIKEALEPDRPLAQTTILTVLSRLKKKNYVRETPGLGRTLVFEAIVPRVAVAHLDVCRLLDTYFDGSPAAMLSHLLDNNAIELEEVRKVQRMVQSYLCTGAVVEDVDAQEEAAAV